MAHSGKLAWSWPILAIACSSSAAHDVTEADASSGGSAGAAATAGSAGTAGSGGAGNGAGTSSGGSSGASTGGTSGGAGTAGVSGSAGTTASPVPGEICAGSPNTDTLVCCSALNTVDWHAARGSCKFQGGDLVKVESSTKNQQVVALIAPLNAWIGLSDEAQETVFKWTDGSPLTGYAPWANALEPDSKGGGNINQNCVFVNQNAVWFDLKCEADGPLSVKGWCCDLPDR